MNFCFSKSRVNLSTSFVQSHKGVAVDVYIQNKKLKIGFRIHHFQGQFLQVQASGQSPENCLTFPQTKKTHT